MIKVGSHVGNGRSGDGIERMRGIVIAVHKPSKPDSPNEIWIECLSGMNIGTMLTFRECDLREIPVQS